jgi:ABC-type polysaccharide/polyol phosphate export permease
MATYFETNELVRMSYPSIVYLLFSIIIWFSAKSITRILSSSQINNKDDLDKNDIKELMLHTIGVLYLITTIPDFVLFAGQSIACLTDKEAKNRSKDHE